ncbi:MAG: ParB/RepB/Spo0J family partition protein [Clostridiaceae bacterium]|jgi:ParB family chromosome partitioning protein|nr:ParB/RepB/Spo0J family partition protein [Clostridiaceae bacterium]
MANGKNRQRNVERTRSKSALGRGLGALISEQSLAREKTEESGERVLMLPPRQLIPNVTQPRQEFDEEKLQELANSMANQGVISPLIVTSTEQEDQYMIVAGERRWRAAKIAGINRIPVIVRDLDDAEAHRQALIDNVVREDLNPVEEAMALERLIDDYDMTQENIASVLGQSRSAVANKLRLLKLPEPILDLVRKGSLSAGHARAILALSDAAAQNRAADAVLARQLSVRDTERMVKKMALPSPPKTEVDQRQADQLQAQIKEVEDRLRRALGSKVTLNESQGKGKIVIYYHSGDERERLIDRLVGA